MGFLRRSKSIIRQRRGGRSQRYYGGEGTSVPVVQGVPVSPSPREAMRNEKAARAGVLPGAPPRGWTLAAAKLSAASAFAGVALPKPRSAETAESDRKNAATELADALQFARDTKKFYEEGSGPNWATRIFNAFTEDRDEAVRKKNYATLLGTAIYTAWNNHVEDEKLQEAKQFLVTAADNDLDVVGYGAGKVVIDGKELRALGSNDGDALKNAIWWAQQIQTLPVAPYVDEKKLNEAEEKLQKRGPQGKALFEKVPPGGNQLVFALDHHDGYGGGRKPRKSRKSRRRKSRGSRRKSRKSRKSRRSIKH